MIKSTVKVGDREVELACSASTPLKYKRTFGKDLLQEINEMSKTQDVTGLSELAFVMAKQANPGIEDNLDDWLDNFDLLDFYNADVIESILDLWGKNVKQLSKPKKNRDR